MAFSITDSNYEYYKQVFQVIWKHMSTQFPRGLLQEGTDPVSVMKSWEREKKSYCKKALKISLLDQFSWLKEFPPELLENIDKDLVRNGLPNIRTLRSVISDMVGKVIKRGRIKNEEEYYVVKEIVVDQDSGYSADIILLLDKYLDDFEDQKK